MQLRKLYYLLLILPLLFINPACSDDDTTTDPPVVVNEAEVLVQYLEANGDPVTTFPKMIKANDVDINITTGVDQYIIDIRGESQHADGHIPGAVYVAAGDVLTHYEANSLQSKEVVVIACFSGQTAAWVTGLMHTAGYTNVRDLKWGMCSWNEATSGSWMSNTNNSRASEFVTTSTAKPAAGDLPTLETGKTEGSEILRARVEAVFAEGFTPAKVSSDEVYGSLSNYFIVNYWVETDYSWGHIDGAMQYTPGASSVLKLDADLKTLSTEKPVSVYCYTGQTSAHVAAYLRVIGYDAKSILFGVNGMSYDTMPGTKFNPDTDIHDYELVQ